MNFQEFNKSIKNKNKETKSKKEKRLNEVKKYIIEALHQYEIEFNSKQVEKININK